MDPGGVRQGCILSPLLFAVTIDRVLRRNTGRTDGGITWLEDARLCDLDFADDTALNHESWADFRLLRSLRRNKLQLLYCSLSVYLLLFITSYYRRSPILWSVFFISLVSHFQSHQCRTTTGSFQSHQHLEERNITCSQITQM